MKTTKGVLRNVTTGILHTKIDDVYQFCSDYMGTKGIMTHELGSACRAVVPILKTKLAKEYFNDEWIKEGLNEPVELADLTKDEQMAFNELYVQGTSEVWDMIKDKTIAITV